MLLNEVTVGAVHKAGEAERRRRIIDRILRQLALVADIGVQIRRGILRIGHRLIGQIINGGFHVRPYLDGADGVRRIRKLQKSILRHIDTVVK